jgi:hypothetical protein
MLSIKTKLNIDTKKALKEALYIEFQLNSPYHSPDAFTRMWESCI